MKKHIASALAITMSMLTFAGCLSDPPPPYDPNRPAGSSSSASQPAPADAVTTASPKESSYPNDLVVGLSEYGYWIFSILSDVTVTHPVKVEGIFHDKDDPTAKVYRKLALYAQDADHNVTAQYTLTLPQLIVSSPNFRIQNGTLKGNVHVDADGFELAGSTIDGDLTFATQAQMDSANLAEGTVTGSTSVGEGAEAAIPDAVTSASPKESSDPAQIKAGLSENGYWIFSILSDVTLTEPLAVKGEFHNKDDAADKIYRKLALYAQDADHNVTAQYTLTVPMITVDSPSFRIQNGTVKGNVHVNADGFELAGSTIDGNLTFATQAQMDSANLAEGTVTGTTSVGQPADAVTSASPKESSDPAQIKAGLSESGYWIFSILSDVTLTEELAVKGEFHDKDDPTAKVYRKLALYAQDADRNVTAQYTLTVPLMTVESPSFRIQNGTVKGNVQVNADGFELAGSTIDGNLTFATQAQMDSANLAEGTVTGTISVG